ncbi:MAG: carboxypeptidase-like regulatory domain-containing protein [Acidobacteriota bacterium]
MNTAWSFLGAARTHRVVVLAIILAVLGARATVYAQQSVASATLSGRVEDANGALVSGANVTVTNLEQNVSQATTSDNQGRFRFLYLPIGNYQIKVERSGFAIVTRELTLTLGQALDLPLRLTVAGVAEKVSVSSDAPLLETVRTQLAETVLPQEIENLPLNGRNYLDLAALTPGVTRANPVANQRFAETSAVPGTQISVAGQRNINNGFVLDGLSANDDAADLPGTFSARK